jgi:integrase
MQPELGVLLKSIGRHMPRQRYQRGSLRKVGKTRRMWEGLYHVYVLQADGSEKRLPRTKVLGPATTMPKGEAQRLLDREIAAHTKQGIVGGIPTNSTLRELWQRYVEIKSPSWGAANKAAVVSIFSGQNKRRTRPSIMSMIGDFRVVDITPDPLQACINRLATARASVSAVKQARTYLHAVLEYAIDEKIIETNPARKLVVPINSLPKPCGRFYLVDEIHRLVSEASGREHLVLRIELNCGLRPSELFLLKDDDVEPSRLRIDEAIKQAEKGDRRVGETKTPTSNGYVTISAGLYEEIRMWQARRGPIASGLLFPSPTGKVLRPAEYLKNILKPLGVSAGIQDLDFQALRRTCSTHFQKHGSPKDAQAQLRHTKLAMTGLYMKEIPAEVRQAVESMDAELCGGQKALNAPVN